MSTFDESTDFVREGWLPESNPESGFAVWNDLQAYNEHDERETTTTLMFISNRCMPDIAIGGIRCRRCLLSDDSDMTERFTMKIFRLNRKKGRKF